jgi:hypothetical protein
VPARTRPIAYHGGSIPRFGAALLYSPSADVIVVVLSNNNWTDAETLAKDIGSLAAG